MEDQQKRKTRTIANLTLAGVFMAGVYFWFGFICDDTDSQNPFTIGLVVARLAVLACALGVLLAMRGWREHWLIKLAFLFVLTLPFITFVVARWAFSFILP